MMQKDNIKIESINDDMLNDVFDLSNKYLQNPWSLDNLKAELNKDSIVFLVAKDEEKVVGYIIVDFILDEGNLLEIVVDKDYRNKGIATKLFESVLSLKEEIKTITLEVRKSNVSAISLYEKLGFSKVGERGKYYKSPIEDAILMTKYL